MEMGVVSGSEEGAKAKACSSEIEAAEETLKDDDVQESGVRVSGNGDKKFNDDEETKENGDKKSNDGEETKENGDKKSNDDEETKENGDKKSNDDEEMKENVVETENLNESGVIEDCMMNGVSSLLKLMQDVSDMENPQVEKEIVEEEEVIEEIEDEEEEDEDDEEEEHGYCVGDFVWGKIKNHPWWPGQIYDPSDASDLALKIKQKGKFLVAYFGDGTFAWCGASQLKPFAENFKECSKISSSRSFLGAVEEAVEEMGRHCERLLICECVEEKNHNLDSPEVNNAGIKEGVLVHNVRREMISTLLCGKHGEILEHVRSFAETVSFSCLLELEILKRKVSTFYRSKRGYGLVEYHEPQSVPGLEDKNNDDDDGDNDDGAKWRAKRSTIEKAPGLVPKDTLQRSLVKCSGFPDHRLHHRRKQKSIAEILENESSAKVRLEIEPVDGDVKLGKKKTKRSDEVNGELENVTTSTSRRRKKSDGSTIEDTGHKQVEESSKGKTSRKRKKRDVDDDDGGGDRVETEINESLNLEVDIDSTPLASLRKRVTVDASSVEKNTGNGETTTPTPKRERKKSKYLSPDYLLDFSRKGRKKSKLEPESSKVSSQSQVGVQMTDASDGLVAVQENKLDNPREPSINNGLGCEELSLRNAVDFLRLGATPNEMQDLIRVAALGSEYPNDSSSRDMVREFMSIYRSFTYYDGANHKFMKSYNDSDKEKEELPETKGIEKKDEKQETKQKAEGTKEIGKEENETDKHETAKKEKSESKKLADEGEETRKESSDDSIKEKRKRKKPKKQGDAEEETWEKLSESTKKERKRKKPESKKLAEADVKEETLKGSSETTKKARKVKKVKLEKEETQNETVEGSEKKKRERKSKKKETEKDHSGAELYVTFGPGSSLPKKEDLIETYQKCGALDKERTEMFYDKFYACVAFLDVADGEKAFESSQENSPFASNQNVIFRLKYSNEKTEAEFAETRMGIEYLKKKLEEMTILLDESAGGMTEEVKVKIVDEMENVLEKVRKM